MADSQRLADAPDCLMKRAVADGVFPGGVLLVGRKDRILFHRAYGKADLFAPRKMTLKTVFDLASLTKPLATALAVLHLHQEEKLHVDQPAARILPALRGTEKQEITLRHLLSHEAGLPAYRPYYLTLAGMPPGKRKPHLRDLLSNERLESPPGRKALYSDLGFMLLEWVVESVSGMPLDAYVERNVYAKVAPSLGNRLFFPASKCPLPDVSFAATEFCPWRNRVIKGEVHDENAAVTGGIGGHAGLFGTALGVWNLLSLLMDAFHGSFKTPLFRTGTLEMAFRPSPVGGKALGFDTPAPVNASCGGRFSTNTVGHLGFTGTSFWMDLKRQVTVILLTNRIHPSRENHKIRTFRPLLHDAVMAALG